MREGTIRLGIGMRLPGRLLLGTLLGGVIGASLYFLVTGEVGYGLGALLGVLLLGSKGVPWLRTAAFLDGRISWPAIAETVAEVLDYGTGNADEASDVLEADRAGRARAATVVEHRSMR